MRKSVVGLTLVLFAFAACKESSNDPVSGPPTTVLVLAGGTAQAGVFGQAVPIAPTVLVTDASNRPVSGAAVTFAVTRGGGTVSAASQTTGANGTASVAWTMGNTFGSNTLTATVAGLPSVSFAANAIAPAAGIIAFRATDPAGDTLISAGSEKAVDLISLNGDFKSDSLIVTATFTAPVVIGLEVANGLAGWLEFDADDNAQTGFDPFTNDFGGTANVRIEYSLNLFGAAPGAMDLNSATATPARIFTSTNGNSVIMRIPMSALGNDDGNFTIVSVMGNRERPTDLFPNTGQTTVRRDFGIASTGNVVSNAGRITTRRGTPERAWTGRGQIR